MRGAVDHFKRARTVEAVPTLHIDMLLDVSVPCMEFRAGYLTILSISDGKNLNGPERASACDAVGLSNEFCLFHDSGRKLSAPPVKIRLNQKLFHD